LSSPSGHDKGKSGEIVAGQKGGPTKQKETPSGFARKAEYRNSKVSGGKKKKSF